MKLPFIFLILITVSPMLIAQDKENLDPNKEELVKKVTGLSKEDAEKLVDSKIREAEEKLLAHFENVFKVEQLYGMDSSRIIDTISILRLIRKSKSLGDPQIQSAGKLLELQLDGSILGFISYPNLKEKPALHNHYMDILKTAVAYRKDFPRKYSDKKIEEKINAVFKYVETQTAGSKK